MYKTKKKTDNTKNGRKNGSLLTKFANKTKNVIQLLLFEKNLMFVI